MPTSASTTKAGEECRIVRVSILILRGFQQTSLLPGDAFCLASESPSHVVSVPSNLLLLCWVIGWMSVCMNTLKAETQFPLAFWISWCLKSDISGTCLSGTGPKGWGASCGTWTFCSSRVVTVLVRSLLLVGHPSAGGVWGHTASLPLLPVSVWSFYPLLWRSCQASFHFFFFFSERIVLYVAVGFGVFWVFLYHHVDLPPLWLFVQRKDYIEFLRHIYKLKREKNVRSF